jgi:hypothetical protein
MRVVQLLVRTNIPELNGETGDDGEAVGLWMDASWKTAEKAQSACTEETYCEVEVLGE